MKFLDGIMTAQMEPEEYLKKLNSYKNRMFVHVGIAVLVQIMFAMKVNFIVCSLVSGVILIDELRRTKFFPIIGRLFFGRRSTVTYRENAYGMRESDEHYSGLFIVIVLALLYIALGYAFAIYFLLFDGVRLGYSAYKAKNIYGLTINVVTYYGIALGLSVGTVLLRSLYFILMSPAA